MAAGSVAIGVALAAVMRRRGMSTPGDLAGVLTTAIMPLLVVVNPLWRRWVTLTPLGDQPHLARTCAAWTAIVVLCAGVTFACMRDPGRAR
jgi:hypothetical protein